MRNIFDVYIFPSRTDISGDICQELERSRIFGDFHPTGDESTGQISMDF